MNYRKIFSRGFVWFAAQEPSDDTELTPQQQLANQLAQTSDLKVEVATTGRQDLFLLKVSEPVITGSMFTYYSPEEAALAPLVKKMFGISAVMAVKLDGNEIIIQVKPEEENMNAVTEQIQQTVTEHLASGVPAVLTEAYPAPLRRHRVATPADNERMFKEIDAIIDKEINPMLAGHGGSVHLVEVKDFRGYVQLAGGCQGCPGARATLKYGVESKLRELLPELIELVDITDHSRAGA